LMGLVNIFFSQLGCKDTEILRYSNFSPNSNRKRQKKKIQ